MNADEVYAYIKGLENINSTLTRENRNLKENGSGNVATIMKLTAELDDYRRSLRHAVEKELSRHTFTVEDIKGWLNWRADEVAKNQNNSTSATERRWLADIVGVECSGIVAWKLGQK